MVINTPSRWRPATIEEDEALYNRLRREHDAEQDPAKRRRLWDAAENVWAMLELKRRERGQEEAAHIAKWPQRPIVAGRNSVFDEK
jgi:hypothetical protein